MGASQSLPPLYGFCMRYQLRKNPNINHPKCLLSVTDKRNLSMTFFTAKLMEENIDTIYGLSNICDAELKTKVSSFISDDGLAVDVKTYGKIIFHDKYCNSKVVMVNEGINSGTLCVNVENI